MKNIWKWILFGIAVFLVAFLIAWPLMDGAAVPVRGAIRYGVMHSGMMNRFVGGWSWIGMLIRLALPVLFVVGGAALVYSLIKRPAASPPPPALPTRPCSSCGKPLDPGWIACPYCGKKQK